jgi:hypothetical protein
MNAYARSIDGSLKISNTIRPFVDGDDARAHVSLSNFPFILQMKETGSTAYSQVARVYLRIIKKSTSKFHGGFLSPMITILASYFPSCVRLRKYSHRIWGTPNVGLFKRPNAFGVERRSKTCHKARCSSDPAVATVFSSGDTAR